MIVLYRQPCDCDRPRHHNGGNYHLRVLISHDCSLAAVWDTRESMSPQDGAVVLIGPEGGLAVSNRSAFREREDYELEVNELIEEGWQPVAYPSGASLHPVSEVEKWITPDWHTEVIRE